MAQKGSTGSPSKKSTPSGTSSRKTQKSRPKSTENFVPIHTGMDTVAEADRSVTDSSIERTADGDGIVRVKVRSKQLMEVFRPIRLFLHIFARFPYSSTLKLDGTVHFTYMPTKTCLQIFNASMFTIGSLISVALFICTLVGLPAAYIGIGSLSKDIELCNHHWEERKMRQAMVPLIVFFCWCASFGIGSVYAVRYGKRLEFYYNYWNRAVQVMDMDATYGLSRTSAIGHIMFCLAAVAYSALFFSFKVELLQSTAAMIVNAFTRWFIPDIYKGSKKAMTLKVYRDRFYGKVPKTEPDVFDEEPMYILLKTCGFLVMMYAMYGARCFIIQFSFFCRVLRNASFIWNERFRNHLMKEAPSENDQTRMRMDLMLLTQDHLILVQLFKMTESIFCVALQWFYAFQIVTVTLALYGFSLITGVMRCQQYWGLVQLHNCSQKEERVEEFDRDIDHVTFESPDFNHSMNKLGDSIVYLVIFVQSFAVLFYTTHAGAAAHEEAMRGWQILRRNSFMTATTVFDRNFVHSLIISFARNNPMQISAGGYFVVNKRLLINIILAVMVYFITLLQFKPGQIDMNALCGDEVLDYSQFADDF